MRRRGGGGWSGGWGWDICGKLRDGDGEHRDTSERDWGITLMSHLLLVYSKYEDERT